MTAAVVGSYADWVGIFVCLAVAAVVAGGAVAVGVRRGEPARREVWLAVVAAIRETDREITARYGTADSAADVGAGGGR